MEKKLLEEINRFILLSKYDTKLTLNENYLINEGPIQTLFRDLAMAGKGETEAIAKEIGSLFKGGEAEAKALFEKIKTGKATSKEVQTLMTDILKNPNLNSGKLFDSALETYATQLSKSLEAAPTTFRAASQADKLSLLMSRGYPKESAQKIIQSYEKIAPSLGSAGKNAVTTADQAAKKIEDIISKGTPGVQASLSSELAKKTVEGLSKNGLGKRFAANVKKFGWKRALKYTAGIAGLSALTLYLYAKGEGATPEDMPTTNPEDAPVQQQNNPELPSDIGGVEGVQRFQTYLDQKYPQGWAKRADGTKYITGGKPEMGFGRFGKNTAEFWAGNDGVEFRKNQQGTPEKTKEDVYAQWRHGQSRNENGKTLVMDKLDPIVKQGQWISLDDFKRKYPNSEITT